MSTKTLLIGTVAAIALTSAASAGQHNGYYISLEGGANWVEDWDHTQFAGATLASASFDAGWAVLATVGHGFGNNFRAELEIGFRDNNGDEYTESGAPIATMSADLSEVTFMANVLYDISLMPSLSLSVGAGAGADYAMLDYRSDTINVSDEDWSFAYQGIVGANYALTRNTELFVNYRYLRVADPEFDFNPALALTLEGDDFVKHTATIGIRYAFGAAAEPHRAVAPPPQQTPAPSEAAAPAEFIVFFGHNKSNLVPEALRVIAEAASAAKQNGSASIAVVGHADRSGSPAHNDALSMRRANVVKDALVSQGIPAGAVGVSAKGEHDPLVPTADGVREPQNRRVNITM